jgi:ribosomal protein S18 acetylase RimI-like enzyme
MRRAHLEVPHVWLDMLGVHPAHQRSGAGSALVDEVVARSERFGVRRFDFQVMSEGALPRGKRFWSLLRPL